MRQVNSVFVAILLSIVLYGCNRKVPAGIDVKNAMQVTFAEFKEAAKTESFTKDGESCFYWVGSNENLHYLQTQKGFYRLTTKFEIPAFKKPSSRMEPGEFRTYACIDGVRIRMWSPRVKTAK